MSLGEEMEELTISLLPTLPPVAHLPLDRAGAYLLAVSHQTPELTFTYEVSFCKGIPYCNSVCIR